MTERQGADIVEMLRSRFGAQYTVGMEAGRREINRVVADEMGVGGDEADRLVGRLIDAGMVRYVTGDEADPTADPTAQHDEHSDRGGGRSDAYIDRDDSLRINAIPGQGGPSAATSGQMGGPVAPPAIASGAAPVAASGTGSAAAGPLAVAAATGSETPGRGGAGYWEFLGERSGVVPSSTRKGQVEPKGT